MDLDKRRGTRALFGNDKPTLARTRNKSDIRTRPDPKLGYAVITPDQLNVTRVKSFYGGKFPMINGGKHRYPHPKDEKKWLRLVADAMTYRNKKRHYGKQGIKYPRDPRTSQFEYVLYHGRPDQIKRRAKRNRDRRIKLANKIGNETHEIHHLDSKNLKEPIALTHCEHMRMHGQKCHESNSPTQAARIRKGIIAKKASNKKAGKGAPTGTRKKKKAGDKKSSNRKAGKGTLAGSRRNKKASNKKKSGNKRPAREP